MSKFEVKVYSLTIEPHHNADTLEIARIGDYTSIVKKDSFKTGDLGVYIPEGALVPEPVLKEMGMWKTDKNVGKGMLSGPDGNRVKAIRLRGTLSQGLIYPTVNSPCVIDNKTGLECQINLPLIKYFDWVTGEWHQHVVHEGQDVAEILGITKYEPPIPVHMSGEVWNAYGFTLNFDIENIKKYNYVLQDGEEIVATEKLHGTFFAAGYNPEAPHDIVQSKGLGSQGLAFKFNDSNQGNIYVKNYYEHIQPIFNEFRESMMELDENGRDMDVDFTDFVEPLYILGEIFGKGVQDLTYGATKPSFRVFDMYRGEPGKGYYLDYDTKVALCSLYNLPLVPLVYRGPYSKEKLLDITTGKETLSGTNSNIREGVVITPVTERYHDDIGRVILKSVSEDYLLRKNGDATEYQ